MPKAITASTSLKNYNGGRRAIMFYKCKLAAGRRKLNSFT